MPCKWQLFQRSVLAVSCQHSYFQQIDFCCMFIISVVVGSPVAQTCTSDMEGLHTQLRSRSYENKMSPLFAQHYFKQIDKQGGKKFCLEEALTLSSVFFLPGERMGANHTLGTLVRSWRVLLGDIRAVRGHEVTGSCSGAGGAYIPSLPPTS